MRLAERKGCESRVHDRRRYGRWPASPLAGDELDLGLRRAINGNNPHGRCIKKCEGAPEPRAARPPSPCERRLVISGAPTETELRGEARLCAKLCGNSAITPVDSLGNNWGLPPQTLGIGREQLGDDCVAKGNKKPLIRQNVVHRMCAKNTFRLLITRRHCGA
jgi:hypothetical protein